MFLNHSKYPLPTTQHQKLECPKRLIFLPFLKRVLAPMCSLSLHKTLDLSKSCNRKDPRRNNNFHCKLIHNIHLCSLRCLDRLSLSNMSYLHRRFLRRLDTVCHRMLSRSSYNTADKFHRQHNRNRIGYRRLNSHTL